MLKKYVFYIQILDADSMIRCRECEVKINKSLTVVYCCFYRGKWFI